MKALTLIIEVLLVGTLFLGCGETITDNSVSQRASFEQISTELDSVMDLFSGDYNITVTFDQNRAKERGISDKTIALANALVDASNEAVDASKTMRSATYNDELLDWFFTQAAEAAAVMDEDDSFMQSESPLRLSLSTYYALKYCGTYKRPIPSKSGIWRTVFNSGDKETATAFLVNKGYHATSSAYGGGFSKKVNYKTRYCKQGSFRDHAYITRQNDGSYIVKEQSYIESSVGGEPNPEIKTYHWPYSVWPAYVLWWHVHY